MDNHREQLTVETEEQDNFIEDFVTEEDILPAEDILSEEDMWLETDLQLEEEMQSEEDMQLEEEMLSEAEEQEEKRRREARNRRREKMRKEKARQLLVRRIVLVVIPVCCILLVGLIVGGKNKKQDKTVAQSQENTTVEPVTSTEIAQEDKAENSSGMQGDSRYEAGENAEESLQQEKTDKVYEAAFGDHVDGISEEDVESTYAIVVDMEQGQVLAAREAKTRISPASMTKILTVLVAAEHIKSLDDKVPITIDITDYAFANDCSAVGFSLDEVVTVRDLMYGTILPSGADAAVALAKYVAGSQEAFVDMMNEKLKTMGLASTTHFTNCVGLYDEKHYSTVYDMAMILQAAIENDLCREVLSAHTFTTSGTQEHPNGITISNWFLRRIEDKPVPGQVLCAKTGFVVQSRNCAASYGKSNNGKGYICVTADAHNGWRCIYDHVALYNKYMGA